MHPEFACEFIGVRVNMVLVIDPDDLDDSGHDTIYLPSVGLRVFVFKLITQNTEVDNISQVIISFLSKPYLVFQATFSNEIIGVTALDLRNLYFIRRG